MRIVLNDGSGFAGLTLERLFERRGHHVVGTTLDPCELVGLVARHRPDVCVLEVATPRSERIAEAMVAIERCARRTDVVVVTGAATRQLDSEALALGARTVVSKSCHGEDLVEQVERRIGSPRPPAPTGRVRAPGLLTPRELEVLRCLADGASTARIGLQLELGETTVRSHVQGILWKLGVHSRSAAIAAGVRTGAIRNDGLAPHRPASLPSTVSRAGASGAPG